MPPITRDSLTAQLVNPIENVTPQRAALISSAIESIYSGLGELSAHAGVTLVLAEPDSSAPVQEFPKMLYKGSTSLLVETPDEETEATKSGWAVHPSARPSSPGSEPEGEAQ